MNKKDIYEHLADIYLDNSRKRKEISKKPLNFKRLFFISISVIVLLSVFAVYAFLIKPNLNSQVALVIQPTLIKINYNFENTKKEMYTFDLKSMDLSKFKAILFSARKAHFSDFVHLKVEFINSFKEISEVYIKDLKYNWQDFKIPFSEFKQIGNWGNIAKLSFVVEEWNVKDKKGTVYIDDIKIIKGGK